MNILITLFLLLLTTILGYSLIRLFKISIGNFFFRIALGFGVGYGVVFLLMIVLYLSNLGWSPFNIITPIIFFLSVYIPFYQMKPISLSKPQLNRRDVLYVATIIVLVCFVFFESIVRPLSSWDGWSSWQMRGKAMFVDQLITADQFHYLETDYPLSAPVYTVFVYEILGEIDDTAILVVSFFFYFMIGIVCLSFLAQKTNIHYSLVFTFLILSTQNVIRHGGRFEAGMADIILSFFILLVLTSLHYVLETKSRAALIVLLFLLSIASQVKNEGMVFSILAVLMIGYYMVKGKIIKKWYLLLLYIIPLLLWPMLKTLFGLPSGILRTTPQIDVGIIIGIAKTQLLQYINVQNWNIGWVFILLSIVIVAVRKKINGQIMLIIAQLILYFFIFLFSSINPIEHSMGILDRLLLHIFPAAVVMLSLFIYPSIKNSRIVN